MKKVVIKKGKVVFRREGNFVTHLAHKVVKELKRFSYRIQIVGSIRRKEKNPVDIDVVLIPKNREKLEGFMRKKARFLSGGEQKSYWMFRGVKIELYYAKKDEWGSMLLAYSSRFGAGIGLRIVAMRKGFKLNQHGLFRRRTGEKIAGKTEREIYHALGRPYKEPWER
ncbi:hypothetical protein HY448_01710 [Candidatus Pacearchaeota archaeon]|nr:hypothetical protein [Candidatus Pacearchaeota archaeon]